MSENKTLEEKIGIMLALTIRNGCGYISEESYKKAANVIIFLVSARLEELKEEKYFFDDLRNLTIDDCIQAIRGK